MTVLSFARRFVSPSSSYPRIIGSLGFSSDAYKPLQRDYELSSPSLQDDKSKLNYYHDGIELPQLIPSNRSQIGSFNIEVVDSSLWPASFILSSSLNEIGKRKENALDLYEDAHDDEIFDGVSMAGHPPDFDEIENLRIQKKLVYKLDRGSKEYEECEIDFHRKKTFKKRLEKQRNSKKMAGFEKSEKSPGGTTAVKVIHKHSLSKAMVCEVRNEVNSVEAKKVRTPTFNQLTDLYHLPFCLDIFVTKGSVRASVIHRVTSKVVAVAHSISKDMKFDLTYKRDATACAAVGKILAQRAIEDDIHNVVYTPRKGDRIEGKLQIVLQSIIDNGVDVKVKSKRNMPRFKKMIDDFSQSISSLTGYVRSDELLLTRRMNYG